MSVSWGLSQPELRVYWMGCRKEIGIKSHKALELITSTWYARWSTKLITLELCDVLHTDQQYLRSSWRNHQQWLDSNQTHDQSESALHHLSSSNIILKRWMKCSNTSAIEHIRHSNCTQYFQVFGFIDSPQVQKILDLLIIPQSITTKTSLSF